MNGMTIGVAAALLLGGASIYGVTQVMSGSDAADERAIDAPSASPLPDARADRVAQSEGGRGAPGRARGVDFANGAAGDDLTDAARARAIEAQAEAERLAMLGTDELDAGQPDGARGRRASGRERGLRTSAPADRDGSLARPRADGDVDRLLAEIAQTAGDGAPSGSATQVRGAKLVDKPDSGGFETARLVDKPDEGGFVASADTQRFEPCQKSDGTAYVGPGTALNPFADSDPCLPQATGQGFEVASLAAPQTDPTPPNVDVANVGRLIPVDVARPFVPAPPPIGTGSDYRG